MFLLNVSLSWGVVVLGMMLLMRTGLVSFGQGLYYCLGAYAAGVLYSKYQVTDIARHAAREHRRRRRWSPPCWACCWRSIATSSSPC